MLEIRIAKKEEYEIVRAFYHSVIDAMENAQYKPAWEKEIYPTNEYLKNSIENNELYIGVLGDEITSAVVVNHNYNESYKEVNWNIIANPDEITVIHILCVHPDYNGKGLGKALVAKAIEIAKENDQKVIRLDVLKGNVPAERLYLSMGFTYVDTIRMFYEDTGWTDFDLYEYELDYSPR